MKKINGSICAPKGFTASALASGIKPAQQLDLALIVSECPCAVANVYTQNKVKGAPLQVTMKHSANGYAQALICNSGNANTATANGEKIAATICQLAAAELNIAAADVLIASTGVIGVPLPLFPFEQNIHALVQGLNIQGEGLAKQAILTTDTKTKESAYAFEIDGITAHIGGIAKGSGMIAPYMATMLAFLSTDIAIAPALLQVLLSETVDKTFNMISVDGDMSTNDMVTLFANGTSQLIIDENNCAAFKEVLHQVCEDLAIMIAQDGEGATKLITCNVFEAYSAHQAQAVAKAVVSSNLVKAAIGGNDANAGRILCAIGYADTPLLLEEIDVYLRSSQISLKVADGLEITAFDEAKALQILAGDQVSIDVYLYQGNYEAKAWGCDLTDEYVKINGSYRS